MNATSGKIEQQQIIKENVIYGLILAFFTLLLHFLFLQKFRVELYTDVSRSLGYYVALNLFNLTAGAWFLFRTRKKQGFLNFKDAVIRMTGVYAVVGLVFISGVAIDNAFIDPGLVEEYRTALIESYEANENLSDEERTQAIEEIKRQTLSITPLSFILLFIVWLSFSLLYSLILGAIFKKEKSNS